MYKLAIVGATGVVGNNVIEVLNEKDLPISEYILLASSRSVDKELEIKGTKYKVQELNEHSFDANINFAIFVAGGDISKKYIPIAKSKGIICIDNSSIFRMDENVPLVVPEVNKEDIKKHKGVIANPNCSTIQAALALKPLDDNYKIKRIVYSTYQAVSGAGKSGIEDLINENTDSDLKKFPYPIFNNCLPHIDSFLSDGYTKEEYKMINETRKILNEPDLPITVTAVRVLVINCHCESINVELENDFDLLDIKDLFDASPGITLLDSPEDLIYPIPSIVDGKDDVFVGRIRRDFSVDFGLNLWVVADNLRKGAALNAVQILDYLINS